MVAGSEIKVYLIDNGNCRVFEINLNKAAYRASHLVHKSAGFAEIFVFCKLRNLSDFNSAYLAVVIKIVKDCADKNFKSSG